MQTYVDADACPVVGIVEQIVIAYWNCQEKCSRINSLKSFSTYAARTSSCSVRYTTGGYPPGLDV